VVGLREGSMPRGVRQGAGSEVLRGGGEKVLRKAWLR
jgi:hypothetical protein